MPFTISSAVGGRGQTMLMVASENGHVQLVIALMDRGANPNAQDHNGDTAMMLAARKRMLGYGSHASSDRCVLYLMQQGADPEIVNKVRRRITPHRMFSAHSSTCATAHARARLLCTTAAPHYHPRDGDRPHTLIYVRSFVRGRVATLLEPSLTHASMRVPTLRVASPSDSHAHAPLPHCHSRHALAACGPSPS